jgi:hypothetical protein
MGLIDFILNLAGLLLWLNWRAAKADPLGRPAPATLIGTLRRAAPANARRWHLPAGLCGLLLLRALFYWQIGSAMGWLGKLDLGVTAVFFRSHDLGQMVLFSIFSFARMFGVFYLWLVLLSVLKGPMPIHRLVKAQLGKVDGWPRWIKLLLPLMVIALIWGVASWPFAWLHPRPAMSAMDRIEESLVIALASYLVWKYLIALLLILYLLNSYIYFGKHPFWNYVTAMAQTLLRPLRGALRMLGRALRAFLPGSSSLRDGAANFSPALKNALSSLRNVFAIALVFFLAGLLQGALAIIYKRLPL